MFKILKYIFNIFMSLKNKIETKIDNKTFIIDSRHRDLDKYPNPSNYKYILDEPIKNVKSIEISSCYMPEFVYTINNNNNILILDYGKDQFNILVPIGIYTSGEKLAKCIQNAIHLKIKNCNILVEFITHLYKLLFIQGDNPIQELSLIFKSKNFNQYNTNSIGNVIGFSPNIFTNNKGKILVEKLYDSNNYIISSTNNCIEKHLLVPNNKSIVKKNKYFFLQQKDITY
ncbi:unnamed protein product, partial [marine sediment metagenome]